MGSTNTDTAEIRQLARQFAETELRPHTEKWDHDAALDPGVLGQLAELGFFGMLIPESHGGMEFDMPTYVSALEEIAWGEPSVALTVAISSSVTQLIHERAGAAQRQQWLERLASGQVVGCIAHAEASGGTTRAARDGDHWVLNGSKSWVTNARLAGVALISAQTDAGNRIFIVPTDTAGFNVQPRAVTMGLRPLEICPVQLSNVRVEADAVLDDVANLHITSVGMLGAAALALGIAQAACDHARSYADVREQFGTKLHGFEGIQHKLADMFTRTEAARGLLDRAAADASGSLPVIAKVFASETAMWVTTQAVQIFGGYGYMRDYPVEKLMRDAKATEMLEDMNEALRVYIAGQLYERDTK